LAGDSTITNDFAIKLYNPSVKANFFFAFLFKRQFSQQRANIAVAKKLGDKKYLISVLFCA
jgi:hypothetical protein